MQTRYITIYARMVTLVGCFFKKKKQIHTQEFLATTKKKPIYLPQFRFFSLCNCQIDVIIFTNSFPAKITMLQFVKFNVIPIN